MKKYLLMAIITLSLLSACTPPPVSDESCFNCGKRPAYTYQLDGLERTFCKTCYEAERAALEQDRANLKNGMN